ncbi:DMT family transporter [Trueperella sp. LYQ143]|uniref:DMT family transporter n=1 Tax=Trueperella sp. LYQ143 TaxID=3391059 RepID=UPI0039830441
MDWVILVGSGMCETIWAVALSRCAGFRRLWPTLIFVGASVVSIAGLGFAMRSIPTGTAYAVWTATGASMTVGYSLVTGEEKASIMRIGLLLALVACVIGLKVVS